MGRRLNSAGSAVKMIVGAAGFGGGWRSSGKINNDQLGAVFADDIGAVSVDFARQRADVLRPGAATPVNAWMRSVP